MPFTVTMPKLSPTMEEGTIVKWHKKEGDHVSAGELLLEVATDKATVEYSALDEGYMRKILIPEKGTAVVNQPIAIFTVKADESIENYQPEGVQPMAPKQETKTATTSPKEEGKREKAASISTPSFAPEPPLASYHYPFPTGPIQGRQAASPLAKKLAKEKGLDLSTVQGSGPGGRVTSRDLGLAGNASRVSFGPQELPTEMAGSYEEESLSPMRKVIAERLQQAKTFIPHIYVRQEIDVEPLIEVRKQLKGGEVNLSFNDFVVRAVALSLQEHPAINSGFHAQNQTILRFKTIDIAVAVSVEGGLITPIIRFADRKNLGEIHAEIKALAERAKQGKLKPEEYKGGSFTISNMGMYGVTDFCAILNPPQAAILAVGGMEECVRLRNGVATLGQKMSLVLSADHRVIDGADAALFLKTLQKWLENPALLIV